MFKKTSILAAGLFLLFCQQGLVAQNDKPAITIRLEVGEGDFIEVGANRLVLSNSDIVEAQVRDDQRGVNLIAKHSGTTDLTVIAPDGTETKYVVFVKGSSLEEDYEEIRQLVTESELYGITVTKTQRSIVAKGSIYSSKELRLWESIKDRFDVTDLVVMEIQSTEYSKLLTEYKEQVAGLISENEILRVELIGLSSEETAPTLKLAGLVLSDETQKQVDALATHYFDKILNQIEVQNPIIEINTSIVTIDLNKNQSRGDNSLFEQLAQVSTSGEAFTQLADSTGESSNNLRLQYLPQGATAKLKANKGNSQGVTVIDSAIAVKSGKEGTVTEGGNVYVKTATDNAAGLTAIETGLRITVNPVVLKSGEIEMVIDVKNIVVQSAEGADEPVTRDSGGKTTTKLMPGQTIVIAGVDKSTTSESSSGTPILEKIPVVNFFFKSKSKEQQNQRTYILITPTYATIRDAAMKNLTAGAFDFRKYADEKAQFQKTGMGFWLGYDPDFKASPDDKAMPYETLKRQ